MKLVADSNGRLARKDLFTPGKPFSAERMGDGSIRLKELVENEVPSIQPVRTMPIRLPAKSPPHPNR
jgi:hypothetical protein